MIKGISRVLLGDFGAREVRRHMRTVAYVNALEPQMKALSDAQLRNLTDQFRKRLADGEALEALLPEAFAAVREASVRTLGMRPFDVQLVGGMVLHEGKIAEMATGEGKTLVATLPTYLNALTGSGVHIVTVNDYLAKRDAEWMGKIYTALGLSVGLIVPDQDPDTKRAAYACDITYGTNNEFGFDYLRDNMVASLDQMVQRGFDYAIVDEVDSILIDEARTPLIISGLGTDSTDWYKRFAQVVIQLQPDEDYKVDEKNRQVAPTEEGVAKVEHALGVEHLYADAETDLSHYLNQALKAKALFHRDRDYMVKDGEVVIVDEFTGRLMFGRRYNEGLHQAIEAKEGVAIQQENPTLASITFQNYFRMYKKLAGMTGTAVTEEEEFRKIYSLDVVTVPTNKPLIRKNLPDLVYKTEKAKFKAVAEDVKQRHETGQPVLVGTVSIEKSERLSEMLTRRGIPHQVLNARYHEQEAQIIAQAGQKGAVTIATNMAGRGTDIVLGPEVPSLGGLHVLGTERHESRRIDNQLRGRSGRQGDPGSSQFYASLDDDLMRIFASDTIRGLLDRLGLEEDQPIESPMLTRAIENAQRKVENRNFEARKQTLDYDDVLNRQRQVLYSERRRVVTDERPDDILQGFVDELVDEAVSTYCPDKVRPEEWDLDGLLGTLEQVVLPPHVITAEALTGEGIDAIREDLLSTARDAFRVKKGELTDRFGEEFAGEYVRRQILSTIDRLWPEHLTLMDDLREGVFLRAYGQRDPLVEYTREAFDMFQDMVAAIRENAVRLVYKTPVPDPTRLVVPVQFLPPSGMPMPVPEPGALPLVIGGGPGMAGLPGFQPGMALPMGAMLVDEQGRPVGVVGLPAGMAEIGRNDPCPCGSGRKYKKCHGQSA